MRESTIRVAVVDGRELFRRGVALLLDSLDQIDVVAEGATAGHISTMPDVVLVDALDPGVAACAELQASAPEARILMLTDSNEIDPFAVMGAGALGLLHKDASLSELAEGIQMVADGHTLVSPSMTARLVDDLQGPQSPGNNSGAPLTARESEVLRLVAGGLSNREIAEKLGIAENTAKNHVRNLLEKLKLRSRTEAAMYAVREKLIEF